MAATAALTPYIEFFPEERLYSICIVKHTEVYRIQMNDHDTCMHVCKHTHPHPHMHTRTYMHACTAQSTHAL